MFGAGCLEREKFGGMGVLILILRYRSIYGNRLKREICRNQVVSRLVLVSYPSEPLRAAIQVGSVVSVTRSFPALR
jgi:hypothetical protein